MSLRVTSDSKAGFKEVDSLPPLTFQEMEKMVRSIQAESIREISTRISECVFNRLNPAEAALIHYKASQEVDDPLWVMSEMGALHAQASVAMKSPPIFSQEKASAFHREFVQFLEQEIIEELKRAGKFVEWGFSLRMTDYNPAEILDKTLTKINVELILGDYPTNYLVYLKVDQEKTAQQGKLALAFIEESQGVELARTTLMC